MSDKELEEYINKIEPNFDSHLEKGTIEMSNEYYNLLEEKMARLINKNQELKKQLDTSNEQANYLRKSVERKEEAIIDLQNERIPYTNEYVDKLENQQKEFINWLESMLDNDRDIFSVVRVKDVLSKYKEIIGENK